MTALRFCGLWLSPALLLGVAAHLYGAAPGGLLLAQLVVLAPCLALLGGQAEPAGDGSLLVAGVTVLAAVLLLSANLLLIGDIASAFGAPSWHGVVIAAGCAFALTIWPWGEKWWLWLGPGALAFVWLVLAIIMHASGGGPVATWSDVASRSAYRFGAESPWVVSGKMFSVPGSLTFSEPHTLRAVTPDAFSVIVSDEDAPSVQEWRPAPGEAITLRPADRLAYPAGSRLMFEGGKRVPGAPFSGVAWADPTARAAVPVELIRFLGIAVTFLAGSFPLLRLSAPSTRAGAATALGLLLAGVGWAEGWAVYAGREAPDLFLGTVRAGSLIQVPALAIGEPWGRRLAGLLTVVLIALLAAMASGLRERIAALGGGGGELGRDVPLWVGVFGVAVVASLWPHDPWSVLVVALGLVASTLAPLAVASPAAPAPVRALACGIGLAAFILVGLGARLIGGAMAESLAEYPALLASPAAWIALRLARPGPA